jgi:DNA-binding XRE family transcriptional regulator
MIRNEREYRITKAQAEKFRTALEHPGDPPKGVHPRLHKASIDAARAQLQDLDAQVSSYEALKAGKVKAALRGSLDELGDLLVRARIARKWTQKQLAERLSVHMQQVQKYEAESYASASLTRVRDVATALGVTIGVDGKLVALPDLETPAKTEVRKEAVRR